MYISDAGRAMFSYLCLAMLMCCSCSSVGSRPFASYDHYWIVAGDAGSAADRQWATYLLTHLGRRTGGRGVAVSSEPEQGKAVRVVVHVDKALPNYYSVARDGDVLHLTARNAYTMRWLLYQFLAATDDPRVSDGDLPPAAISMEKAAGDFAFEYRGIYSPFNSDPELMPVTASHNVDYDWALWGHNLRRVFTDGVPDEAKASVDGKKTAEQFCFSSEKLFKAIESYVIDNYGEGKKGDEMARFSIMPEDNDIVCTCEACVKAGNTRQSATPAVSRLLRRLAVRFPGHIFFTSSYLTTKEAPTSPLPANTGVIISAIDIPMRSDFAMKQSEMEPFSRLVSQWQKATQRVYVWDYMRNFDDYLTPYPCLNIMAGRLRYYQRIGIKGVFLNGSGGDYAPFDDVQTATLAALLVNPGLSAEDYVGRCIKHFYPLSGNMLSEAYLSWEGEVDKRHATLPFYGGIGDAVKAWLNPETFGSFCDELDKKSKNIRDDERRRLNKMLTALQFTRLELLRMPYGRYNRAEAELYLESLGGHTTFADMRHYREAYGDISTYIKEWGRLIAENAADKGLLKGVLLAAGSATDDGYDDMSLLTDGLHALPSDYHTGWVLSSSGQTIWKIPAGNVHGGTELKLSFMHAPKWRIRLPEKVEVWQDGRLLSTADMSGAAWAEPFTKHTVSCKLGAVSGDAPVELRVMPAGSGRTTVACDEISMY